MIKKREWVVEYYPYKKGYMVKLKDGRCNGEVLVKEGVFLDSRIQRAKDKILERETVQETHSSK